MIDRYPRLFPPEIAQGYTLHDRRVSRKLDGRLILRRIGLKARLADSHKQTYTFCPASVLPYLVGYTDDAKKALFLRRFDVPYRALTYVFGHDDSC